MVSNLSKILNDVYTYVLPGKCFGCNATLYRGEHLLCAFCRNELPLTEFTFGTENTVDRIFYGCPGISKASAFLYYTEDGIVQRLLHALKYQGQERIGTWLGAWYGRCMASDTCLKSVDIVIPVPLHPSRLRKRGYNQCRLLGREVAISLGATYSEKFLKRNIPTGTQTRRERWDRWQNTGNAFRLRSADSLEDRRILLIDDVITTGATIEACCDALKGVMFKELYVAALAVVP